MLALLIPVPLVVLVLIASSNVAMRQAAGTVFLVARRSATGQPQPVRQRPRC